MEKKDLSLSSILEEIPSIEGSSAWSDQLENKIVELSRQPPKRSFNPVFLFIFFVLMALNIFKFGMALQEFRQSAKSNSYKTFAGALFIPTS